MITVLTNIPSTQHSPLQDIFETDEKRYEWQMGVRANYLLLGDKRVNVPVDTIKPRTPVLSTTIKWINRGELIAGSFMSIAVQGATLDRHNDIDIYFKCEADALAFVQQNKNISVSFKNNVLFCAHSLSSAQVDFNLIFGIHYDDAADLISHFDIRACSIALDPTNNIVYAVAGALGDCCQKRIVYNPVPHNTTVARLVKYIKKGFEIDPYQRLFFSELIKSDQYNIDLELTTGYRAVPK